MGGRRGAGSGMFGDPRVTALGLKERQRGRERASEARCKRTRAGREPGSQAPTERQSRPRPRAPLSSPGRGRREAWRARGGEAGLGRGDWRGPLPIIAPHFLASPGSRRALGGVGEIAAAVAPALREPAGREGGCRGYGPPPVHRYGPSFPLPPPLHRPGLGHPQILSPPGTDSETEIQPAATTAAAAWLGRGPVPQAPRPIEVTRMELWPGAWTALLLLLLLLLSTLWFCSSSAKYFMKMAFYNGWILFLAILAIPVCAVRGRNVENMKILRLLLLHVKYLYGIRVEVRGAHHFPPTQPYVVVSNHQSSLDLLGMMEVLPDRCVPIAKRELLWAGSAGLACWLAGVIFIDRKRTGDAISVMSEVAQTLLTQDVRVWVFPEGTRNHNGSMLPFKRGAFHLAVQAQVPIIPIVMSSYQDFYSKKERRFTSGRCQVRVLPPVPTEGLTPDDVPALADRVRHSMLTIFREISTDGLGGGDCLKKPGGAGEARL